MRSGIQSGDVGLTRSRGPVAWLVRHGSGSAYAHSFVFHELLVRTLDGSELWSTIEAFPALRSAADGVRQRTRVVTPADPRFELAVFRPARSADETAALLAASAGYAGVRYDWGEIVRLGLRGLGIKLRRWTDNPTRAICSHHCTAAVLAARPDLAGAFPVPSSSVWPGLLAAVLVTAPSVPTVPAYAGPPLAAEPAA